MPNESDKRRFTLQYLVDAIDDGEEITPEQVHAAKESMRAAGIDLEAWADEVRATVATTLKRRKEQE